MTRKALALLHRMQEADRSSSISMLSAKPRSGQFMGWLSSAKKARIPVAEAMQYRSRLCMGIKRYAEATGSLSFLVFFPVPSLPLWGRWLPLERCLSPSSRHTSFSARRHISSTSEIHLPPNGMNGEPRRAHYTGLLLSAVGPVRVLPKIICAINPGNFPSSWYIGSRLWSIAASWPGS